MDNDKKIPLWWKVVLIVGFVALLASVLFIPSNKTNQEQTLTPFRPDQVFTVQTVSLLGGGISWVIVRSGDSINYFVLVGDTLKLTCGEKVKLFEINLQTENIKNRPTYTLIAERK
ncbi:MAG: hypothetical protein WCT08_05440 [Patescibacteria group bacterium]